MGKCEIIRFWDVATYFNDDERIMAYSIAHFIDKSFNPDQIWRDLLDCKYDAWIDYLEQVINEVKHTDLEKFKTDTLKHFKKGAMAKGDILMIQERGWKLHIMPKAKLVKKSKRPKTKVKFDDYVPKALTEKSWKKSSAVGSKYIPKSLF